MTLGGSSATDTFTVSDSAQTISVSLPPQTYAVTISVTTTCPGVGGVIEGATVTAYGGATTYGPLYTDASGNVTFQLPQGTYTYDITASGYQSSLGLALNVTGVTSLTPLLVPEYCLTSLKVYQGAFPTETEVDTVSASGGTYYVHVLYEGTPPAGDVTFTYFRDDDQNTLPEGADIEIGVGSIVGNEAYVTWNPAGLTPGHVAVIVNIGVNWQYIWTYITVVE